MRAEIEETVMSGNHIVVGAGAVGTATARLLADSGEQVTIVSRSGSGPDSPRVDRVALDAGDTAALVALARGAGATAATRAAAIYNCVNHEYHRWSRDWPPVAASLLAAAEASGAVLVTTGNLYPYGPVDGTITAVLPDAATGTKGRVRAQMWADAKAAHDAGRVRAVEVRGSDYLGNGAKSHINRLVPRILAGKGVRVVGAADELHSWTYVPDAARTLVTVAADERAWGRVWLVPTGPPRTQREAVHDLCRAAGVSPVTVGVIPHAAMRALGVVSPAMRELEETRYQFTQPFVIDASKTEEAFGLAPTGWDVACAETVRWYRESRSSEMSRK